MNTQPPSIGRIVQFNPIKTETDKEPRPAMIVHVHKDEHRMDADAVELQVFSPSGGAHRSNVPWSSDGRPGTWCWLPKVEPRPLTLPEASDGPPTEKTS